MVSIVRQNFKKNIKLFNDTKQQLKAELGEDIPITHVGSTAIPRMSGKNIIDVLVGAQNPSVFTELVKKITDLGYFPSENSKTAEYQFFASREEETRSGDTHIHLVLLGTDRYNDFITLKNYLLKHPKMAKAYSNNKKDVIKFSEKNRSEYRRIKSDFVSELIRMARNEL